EQWPATRIAELDADLQGAKAGHTLFVTRYHEAGPHVGAVLTNRPMRTASSVLPALRKEATRGEGKRLLEGRGRNHSEVGRCEHAVAQDPTEGAGTHGARASGQG